MKPRQRHALFRSTIDGKTYTIRVTPGGEIQYRKLHSRHRITASLAEVFNLIHGQALLPFGVTAPTGSAPPT